MNHINWKAAMLVPAALLIALVMVLPLPAGQVQSSGGEFTATINEAQEVDCNLDHNATGTGTFKLDKATGDLSFDISFTALSVPEVAAHIHGPAAPGVGASVVRGLPLGSPKVGSVEPPLTGEEMADLQAGLYYGRA